MASKRKEKRDNPAQSRRFEETARKVEADERGSIFERVLKKIVPKKNK